MVTNNLDLCPSGGTVDSCDCCSTTSKIIGTDTDCTYGNTCVGCIDTAACNYGGSTITIGSDTCTYTTNSNVDCSGACCSGACCCTACCCTACCCCPCCK